MDELATKLVDSLTKVENALETMAPTAFQALVEAAYITGAITVVWGFVQTVVAIVGILLLHAGTTAMANDSSDKSEIWWNTKISMVVGGGFLTLIFCIAALFNLGNSSAWLKVINPTAYVVKTLLAQ